MAEPVGITGTAVGIVSFGLWLYAGISEYVDAVKGRESDLHFVKQYAKTLRDCLRSIDETINTIGSNYTAARNAVEQCKSSCEAELRGLETLVQELRGPFVDPVNRTEQAKNTLRKFNYPFNKENIIRLQERLSSNNNVLSMAILALQLAESPRSQILQLLEFEQYLRGLCDAVVNVCQRSESNLETETSESSSGKEWEAYYVLTLHLRNAT